jgi:hypothetical protein
MDKIPWVLLGVGLTLAGLYGVVVLDEWFAQREIERARRRRRLQ